MRIHLASDDKHLQKLCREILSEILTGEWSLHIAHGTSPECEADLYLWEGDPKLVLGKTKSRDGWRHFFFLDRLAAQHLRSSMAFSDVNVVLKPVTRAALMAFLPEACKRCGTEPAVPQRAVLESLRADRDELLQGLMQANLKLQEYDQDRTNFLARAIHDFRAPLTAVTGYCGLLLSEDLGSLTDDQREVLERMQHSAKKLSRMASAMFQLSIAPRAEVTLDLQKGEIRDCIEQALHEILPPAEEKRLSISVDTLPSPEPLYFERMKLEQVLVNLLDNACKFAPRGGAIELKGYPYYWDQGPGGKNESLGVAERRIRDDRSANSYRIDIRDTGPGIPAGQLTRIFEEYTSYAGGVDRSGGGLGLAICRMILNQHNGRIWAESSPGGAVFSFVLPFHRVEIIDHTRMKRQFASSV